MAKIVFFRPKFGKLSAIEMTLLHLHDLSTCLKSTYFAVLFIYLFIPECGAWRVFIFIFSILWCSQIGYHAQKKLSQFGYRLKIENFKNLYILVTLLQPVV
jgi:hypothetical protein